jgi:hypothetical protein
MRQRMCLAGLTFDAEGRHIQAPGNRFRTQLRTCQGDVVATSLVVSDGVHHWLRRRVDSGPWEDMRDADPVNTVAGSVNSGVVPLLRDLRRRLNWVGRESGGGDRQIRLVGVWKPDSVAALVPTGQAWPDGLPKVCRLCLDSHSLWPNSVEWWGPSHANAASALLASVEFGTPTIGKPLPQAECSRLFTIDSAN